MKKYNAPELLALSFVANMAIAKDLTNDASQIDNDGELEW